MGQKVERVPSYPLQWWQKLDATNSSYFGVLLWQLQQTLHADYREWELASMIPSGSRRLVSGPKTDAYRRITQGNAAHAEKQALEAHDALLGNSYEYGWVVGGIGKRRGKLSQVTFASMYIDTGAVSIYRRKPIELAQVATVATSEHLFASVSQYLQTQTPFGPYARMLQ